MSIDGASIGALLAALAEIPARLAALERENAETRAALAAIRAALPPVLVTIPDAARTFKVSLPTMRRWARDGRVPAVRIGSTIRVDLSRLRGTDDLAVARAAQMAQAGKGSLAR